jgi:hypothetical protein
MDTVSICGFSDLSLEQQNAFIEHVINPANWARASAVKAEKSQGTAEQASASFTDSSESKFRYPVNSNSVNSSTATGQTAVHSATQKTAKEEEVVSLGQVIASTESAVAVQASRPQKLKGAFNVPIPGKDGAVPGAMAGLNVVLTGL